MSENVTDHEVAISTPDGTANGVLYRPDSKGSLPGVVCLTDIGGVRPANEEVARRIAAMGYVVLLPNMFYRIGRRAGFRPKPGATPEENKSELMRMVAAFTPDVVERDGHAYVDFLAAQPGIEAQNLAVIGYCFSGAIALRIAAAFPDRVTAVASFHGGRLATDQPDSPHLLLPKVRARLYFGHAEDDSSMPAEAIAKLEKALAGWGGRYESEVYKGAHHGWTMPGGPTFDPAQAERAFGKLTHLLQKTQSATA